MDWLTPLTGFVGVVVGAATSYVSTHQTQKQQLADARLARDEAERAAVVAANAQALTALLSHIRNMPPDSSLPEVQRAEYEQLFAREEAWWNEMLEYIEPARVAALEVRNEELRTLIVDGLTWIHDCHYFDLGLYQRSREWMLMGTVHHLIACVFSWRRGDTAMPEPNGRYKRLKEVWEYEEEVRRIEAAEREAAQ
ncbi:hypothetical protein OG458_28530 [Streptomyces sp. NBC_01281]|uniref:hypothetical protein n=1 Tax=Streptomyces sp. NBC_01281 TaxID=2903811 RepID=UPI002E13168C|nr:hypothetical protein OG458_28530 [Streptomyces sp. NBC_01281]